MPAGTNTLLLGEEIKPGEELISTNKKFGFAFHSDGNLEVYSKAMATPEGRTLWAAIATDGRPVGNRFFPEKFALQSNGNLVAFAQGDTPYWETTTAEPT